VVDAADADLGTTSGHVLAVADLEGKAVVADKAGRRGKAEAAVGAELQHAVGRWLVEGEAQRIAVQVRRQDRGDERLVLLDDELLQHHAGRVVDRRDLQGHGRHRRLQRPVAQAVGEAVLAEEIGLWLVEEAAVALQRQRAVDRAAELFDNQRIAVGFKVVAAHVEAGAAVLVETCMTSFSARGASATGVMVSTTSAVASPPCASLTR
jgi:hypothetical protein